MANVEVFDSYFRRADLDKDGRISGQEAVGFFQGAGLPRVTLAEIWQFADQGRTGFLSRVEFYNALKLVTVAQTGRKITPELVRAALTGPAAPHIPPPRINAPGGPAGGAPAAFAPVASSQRPRPQGGPVVEGLWPQMSESDVERYSPVFMKVDTDKDGKITGEQARELFLSWQLPGGVLEQVWDLSDQDSDSMLSLREFCTALYVMERFREGWALPSTLPSGIHPDRPQAAAGAVPQGAGVQSAPVWRHVPGPPATASAPTAGGSKPADVAALAPAPTMLQMPERAVPAPGQSGPEAAGQEPYKSKVPALDADSVDHLSRDEQEMLKTKHKAPEEADKKVFELDREIQDCKEKIELYRTKLQEIVSDCTAFKAVLFDGLIQDWHSSH